MLRPAPGLRLVRAVGCSIVAGRLRLPQPTDLIVPLEPLVIQDPARMSDVRPASDRTISGLRIALVSLAATAVQFAVALAWSSPAGFRFIVAVSQRVFGGSIADPHVFEDVRAYHEYASAPFSGRVPYRDVLIEYPPAAFPLFLVPRLVAPSLSAFRWAFAFEMGLCGLTINALVAFAVARWQQPRDGPRRLAWLTLALAALGPLPIARFDLAPTALAIATLVAWQCAHPISAGILAGIGTLAKLFPGVVLVPCLAAASPPGARRQRGAFVSFVLTLVAGLLAWFAIGGPGVGRSITYHTERGLEITSVWSTLLIPAAWCTGARLSYTFDHHSCQLVAPGAVEAARFAPLAQLAALALVACRARRSQSKDLPRFAAAAVLGYAALGKVLSPQYLIWVLPFLALIPGSVGRRARFLGLGCALLTGLVYPFAAVAILKFQPLALIILCARNLLLVILLAVLILPATDERNDLVN